MGFPNNFLHLTHLLVLSIYFFTPVILFAKFELSLGACKIFSYRKRGEYIR